MATYNNVNVNRSTPQAAPRHWSWTVEMAWDIVRSSTTQSHREHLGPKMLFAEVRDLANEIRESYNKTPAADPKSRRKTKTKAQDQVPGAETSPRT